MVSKSNIVHFILFEWALGTTEDTKTDIFSEKFQMAFDPPPSPLPHFRKIILRFFQEYMTEEPEMNSERDPQLSKMGPHLT